MCMNGIVYFYHIMLFLSPLSESYKFTRNKKICKNENIIQNRLRLNFRTFSTILHVIL